MRQALKLHPDSHCSAVTGIEVRITRPRPGSLVLHYFVAGRTRDLRLPPATSPTRGDQLWQHTCFEAFVRASPGAAYYEFNFAPSMQWAAYHFSGYRTGLRDVRELSAPSLEVRSDTDGIQLLASLELDHVPDLASAAQWRLGIAAVIEEMRGEKSYWALAHSTGKADFHHSDCFSYKLAAAEQK